jgi:hypothetical protein
MRRRCVAGDAERFDAGGAAAAGAGAMRKRYVENRAVWLGRQLHTHRKDGAPRYITGVVFTHHGLVSVYAQGFDGHDQHTRCDFVWGGRHYLLSVPRLLTERGIVTLARRFASEVYDGQHD